VTAARRLVAACLALCVLARAGAGESDSGGSGDSGEGYAFVADASEQYVAQVEQHVAWESAGETLDYVTTISWSWALKVVEATPERAVLRLTELRVIASHVGPGSERVVDSSTGEGADDPLIGHLAGFDGVALTLTLDPATGVVGAVDGGDQLVARINKRAPGVGAGATPPHDAAARAAYSSENLARWWTQLLALPAAEPQRVPLADPLTGAYLRTWTGDSWKAAGDGEATATLGTGPSAVALAVRDLAGEGRMVVRDGMPELSSGAMTFTLELTALTQPVAQKHHLRWSLARVRPRP